MRRWLVIVLLALLPFQFSWAAVARYCGHEAAQAQAVKASHFGHHEHQHEHDLDQKKPALQADDDCAYCHLGCAQPLPVAARLVLPQIDAPRVAARVILPSSHLPAGPERPDRRPA